MRLVHSGYPSCSQLARLQPRARHTYHLPTTCLQTRRPDRQRCGATAAGSPRPGQNGFTWRMDVRMHHRLRPAHVHKPAPDCVHLCSSARTAAQRPRPPPHPSPSVESTWKRMHASLVAATRLQNESPSTVYLRPRLVRLACRGQGAGEVGEGMRGERVRPWIGQQEWAAGGPLPPILDGVVLLHDRGECGGCTRVLVARMACGGFLSAAVRVLLRSSHIAPHQHAPGRGPRPRTHDVPGGRAPSASPPSPP